MEDSCEVCDVRENTVHILRPGLSPFSMVTPESGADSFNTAKRQVLCQMVKKNVLGRKCYNQVVVYIFISESSDVLASLFNPNRSFQSDLINNGALPASDKA